MGVERKIVGKSEYKGSEITVRHMGPDLLGYVDGVELSGFFTNTAAAIAGGERYVDQMIKERNAKQ